ncbi:hypothetical protein BCR34DRAFT_563232 [Clohesyomyces aquaticus]|uniref:Uncharacterized protein n=1 Tax=Clohesyomyces aquaticus TaxID=1231657 RepID=A0A1Y1ZR39_9PLEO|nr:hypothetical protein BCR34DRAFT_563232 [Clohesyomyces aquaticus]
MFLFHRNTTGVFTRDHPHCYTENRLLAIKSAMRGCMQGGEAMGSLANNGRNMSHSNTFSSSHSSPQACEPCAHASTTTLTWSRQERHFSTRTMAENDGYSPERVRKLEADRQRFLEFSYMTMGTPPSEEYNEMRKQVQEEQEKTPASYVKSEELTVTSKVNCPCHEGCKADHGAFYIAETMCKRRGQVGRIEVKEDTGSGPNWISASYANALGLSRQDVQSPLGGYQTLTGEAVNVTHKVSMTLLGRANKSCGDEFLIAPDGFPVEGVMLGRQFIEKYGHPFALFSPKEGKEVLLVVENKVSQGEKVAIKGRRAEADRKAKDLADRRQQAASRKGNPPSRPRKTMSSASGSTL